MAALTACVAAGPAVADPTVKVDRSCYAPGDTITRTGAGFAPNAKVAESVTFQTATIPAVSLGTLAGPTAAANGQGTFSSRITAPRLRRARDFTEAVTDTFTDPSNPAKPAVAQWTLSAWYADAPAWYDHVANPGRSMTVYAEGWTSSGTTLYMHYFFGTKRYATVRVGRLAGECGDLSEHVRQFPFAHVRSGAWKVFFSTTKTLDKVHDIWLAVKVRVPRGSAT